MGQEKSMFAENAAEKLRRHGEEAYGRKEYSINERIRCFVGFGHSNCTVIEGETSLILIDALDSGERARRLKEKLEQETGKTVETIIYTHGHPDHRGGAGAF